MPQASDFDAKLYQISENAQQICNKFAPKTSNIRKSKNKKEISVIHYISFYYFTYVSFYWICYHSFLPILRGLLCIAPFRHRAVHPGGKPDRNHGQRADNGGLPAEQFLLRRLSDGGKHCSLEMSEPCT